MNQPSASSIKLNRVVDLLGADCLGGKPNSTFVVSGLAGAKDAAACASLVAARQRSHSYSEAVRLATALEQPAGLVSEGDDGDELWLRQRCYLWRRSPQGEVLSAGEAPCGVLQWAARAKQTQGLTLVEGTAHELEVKIEALWATPLASEAGGLECLMEEGAEAVVRACAPAARRFMSQAPEHFAAWRVSAEPAVVWHARDSVRLEVAAALREALYGEDADRLAA